MCALLFDAHCHLADARLAHCDMRALLDDAAAAGVRHLVVNGTCEGDWPRVAALADSQRAVVPSYGRHPWRVAAASPRWAESLQAALVRQPRAALGEAGLHHGTGCDASPAQQAEALATQLGVAVQLRRPVALHCVRAQGAMHDALLAAAPASGFLDTGLLLHGYSGSAEMVPRFAALGAHFSFSAALGGMAEARAAALVRAVPDERLLLETDAPDGLPRGGSAALSEAICEEAAARRELRGFSSQEVSRASTKGARTSPSAVSFFGAPQFICGSSRRGRIPQSWQSTAKQPSEYPWRAPAERL
jgi:TatD DNase family protein